MKYAFYKPAMSTIIVQMSLPSIHFGHWKIRYRHFLKWRISFGGQQESAGHEPLVVLSPCHSRTWYKVSCFLQEYHQNLNPSDRHSSKSPIIEVSQWALELDASKSQTILSCSVERFTCTKNSVLTRWIPRDLRLERFSLTLVALLWFCTVLLWRTMIVGLARCWLIRCHSGPRKVPYGYF